MSHKNCALCKGTPSSFQLLLDEHTRLSNILYHGDIDIDGEVAKKLSEVTEQIQDRRLVMPPPACYGEGDCSTFIMVHCAWSIDCG